MTTSRLLRPTFLMCPNCREPEAVTVTLAYPDDADGPELWSVSTSCGCRLTDVQTADADLAARRLVDA